jgi:hypothetical protein
MNFLFIQTNDDEHEQDHLIDDARNTKNTRVSWNQPKASTPTSPYYLSHARSDTNLIINLSSPSPNELSTTNNNNTTIKSLNETKRTHSMFTSTKCSPS